MVPEKRDLDAALRLIDKLYGQLPAHHSINNASGSFLLITHS